MMICKDKCMDLIGEKFPDFLPIWKSLKSQYTAVERTFQIEVSWLGVFSSGMDQFYNYMANLLIKPEFNSAQKQEFFNFIEFLLTTGDEDVKWVISDLLENILKKMDPKLFVEYLGPKSQEWAKYVEGFRK